MEYLQIKGIDRKCSRFIIGTMTIKDPDGPESEFKKLDDAWEQGVNVIDAAHSYGAPRVGSTEIALGKWVKSRGLKREEYTITTKCGHPRYFDFNPFLSRNAVHSYDMESELNDSLCKWHTDYVDVLYLHRDDPNTSVAEIIETFNKFKKEGKVRVFGAANWQFDRIKEANDYAEAHGLQGFGIVEEHYSVAAMYADPFCPAASAPAGSPARALQRIPRACPKEREKPTAIPITSPEWSARENSQRRKDSPFRRSAWHTPCAGTSK